MIRVVARFLVLLFLTCLSGCGALTYKTPPAENVLYELAGRFRVTDGDDILRGDYLLSQTSSGLRILLSGTFGLGRVEVVLQDDKVTIHRKNQVYEALNEEELNEILPSGEWLFDLNILDWLTLRPLEDGNKQETSGWQDDLGEVKVIKTQWVNGVEVCKRLDIEVENIRTQLLCDRWRIFEGEHLIH